MRKSAIALLFCITTFACPESLIQAEPPADTIRHFAELTDSAETCLSWESDTSKRIVSHKDGGTEHVVEFITPGGPWLDEDALVLDGGKNVVLDLRSTRWVRMPVVHVTTSGAEEVSEVYWLQEDLDDDGAVEPPRPGMTAATGPTGEVVEFIEIRIAQASSSDSFNPNRYYLSANGPLTFYVAIGVFQR